MKRFTAGIIFCICMGTFFAGCFGKDKSADTDPLTLVGTWELIGNSNDTESGYIFGEDGKVSIYTDISDYMHFEDGDFVFGEERVQKDMIQYDGDKMTINHLGRPLLVLDRIGDADTGSFDGEYTVEDCIIRKNLISGMAASSSAIQALCFSIKGSSSIVMAVNVMDYKYNGDLIEFSNYIGGESAVEDISGKAKLSDDELIIECRSGKERRLRRQAGEGE